MKHGFLLLCLVIACFYGNQERNEIKIESPILQLNEFVALYISFEYASNSTWANLLTSSGAKKIREIVIIINSVEKKFTLREFENKLGFKEKK